jgi:hypothetical protein
LSNTTTAIVVRTTNQVNETHAGTAAITLLSTNGTRIGVFQSGFDNTASRAVVFADAFTNLALQDIIQVVSPAGEAVVNYVDYLGVTH